MEWQTPNDSAVVSKSVKAKGMTFDGGGAENANIHELAVVRKTVVQKFLAEKTVESRNVNIQCGQLLPFLSSVVLRQE